MPSACAGDDPEQLCDDVLTYMASQPSVAKFAVPDDCVVVKVGKGLVCHVVVQRVAWCGCGVGTEKLKARCRI